MRKLMLLFSLLFLFSCEDTRVETLEPSMQMWVNGDPIDPFDYYGQVNIYGEKSVGEDGKIKKLLVMIYCIFLVNYHSNILLYFLFV